MAKVLQKPGCCQVFSKRISLILPALSGDSRNSFHLLPFERNIRGVAQLASAPRSGRGGRRFESSHPDKTNATPALPGFCVHGGAELARVNTVNTKHQNRKAVRGCRGFSSPPRRSAGKQGGTEGTARCPAILKTSFRSMVEPSSLG